MGDEAELDFERDVFTAELADLRARIEASDSDKDLPPDGATPSTDHELVGVALSGGGIRSATFALGVMQALYRRGVFDHVDYLSTVSGGGYLGATLSAWMRDGAGFPFSRSDPGTESDAVLHLRDNSNYLAPDRSFDALTLATVIARGIVVNLLILLPFLLVLAVLAAAPFEDGLRAAANGEPASEWTYGFTLTPWLCAFTLFIMAVSPLWTRWLSDRVHGGAISSEASYDRRMGLYRSFAVLTVITAVVAFVEAQPFFIFLAHSTFMPESSLHQSMSLVVSAAGSWGAGMYLQRAASSGETGASSGQWRLVALGLLGPLLPALIYIYAADWLVFDAHRSVHIALMAAWMPTEWVPEVVTLFVAGVMACFAFRYVDVNEHSGHGYWRDRISRAYLIEQADSGTRHVDGVRFSELSQPGSAAPYHLVNTTVNLQGVPQESSRGRNGDFCLFSKYFLGSPRLGYAPMERVETVLPHMTLGTGIAISSAAAAPNMGALTMSALTMLLTLLNVRMDYWIPHPRRFHRWQGLDANVWRPGAWSLVREMRGALDDAGPVVNLSDGGHLENLGAYELLRRRCRYIIVSDGEADAQMQFFAMSTLIRYARVDLGIEIDIDLDGLRLDPDGFSSKSGAVGTIRYPATDGHKEETGYLLYIKASMTGNEDVMLRYYKEANPSFPHQSTANQFFSEEQFEAYRSLGFAIADTLLAEAGSRSGEHTLRSTSKVTRSFAEFRSLMHHVRVHLAPTCTEDVAECVELQRPLAHIDHGVAGKELFRDQHPELVESSVDLNRPAADPAP